MLLAISIMGLVSYSMAYSALMEQVSVEKINTLAQTRNTADVTLKEIEKTFVTESVNPQLIGFSVKPFDREYELMKDIIKGLVKIKNSNKYIFSVYVYLPQHDRIVTTEDGLWKIKDFYDLSWLDSVKKENTSSWTTTRRIQTLAGENLGVVTYVTPIPFDEYADTSRSLLVVNVYEKELLKLVQGYNTLDKGTSFIVDSQGKVVAHKDKSLLGNRLAFDASTLETVINDKSGHFSIKVSDEKSLISHVKSEYSKWSYISVIPEKQITQPISYLRTISIIVALICMLLGLVASRIVSSRIYRPISKTILSAKKSVTELDSVIKDNEVKDEMDFLSTTIERIVEKNRNLKSMMQKNETALRDGLILDLLLGSSMDEVQMEYKLKQLNFSFSHEKFHVLVLLIDRYSSFIKEYNEKDRALFSFAIKNISEEVLNGYASGVLVQTDKDKFAAVFNNSCSIETAMEAAEKIRENIKSILKFSITVGVSSSCSTPLELGLMYKEALDLAKTRIVLGGDRSICSKDIGQGGNDILLISSSREEQILNSIKQGNIGEALRNIEKIVSMIRKEPGYAAEEIHQFFYSVLCISIKAVNENGWSVSDIFGDNCNLYRELVENDTVSDIMKWINDILMKMSNFIIEKKVSKNFSLIESILNYMHTNYNKDISLNSMADYVSLSTPYLSKLFKSETGENFLEYLTRLRIEKSKELLLNPGHKITDISEKVNFGNAQNYIRIFKKYEGMTPGQYREMNIKDSLNKQQVD